MSYFIITIDGNPEIPLLDLESGSPSYFYKASQIENPQIMTFRFGKPVPRRPKMGDYFSTPNSVVSNKIWEVLHSMEIDGLQILPARILDQKGKIHEGYWALHLYNRIRCIDLEQSELELDDFSIDEVEKLVLDKTIIDSIPLSQRLAFRLEEDAGFQLYHESVADKILATNPSGVRFVRVEDWNETTYFN